MKTLFMSPGGERSPPPEGVLGEIDDPLDAEFEASHVKVGSEEDRKNFEFTAMFNQSSKNVGLEVYTETGHCVVLQVDVGGQGHLAGVRIGDVLIYIEDVCCRGLDLVDVASTLKECREGHGPPSFILTFWRGPQTAQYKRSACSPRDGRYKVLDEARAPQQNAQASQAGKEKESSVSEYLIPFLVEPAGQKPPCHQENEN